MKRTNLLMFMRSLLLLTCLVVPSIPAQAQQTEGVGTVWFYRDTDPSPLDPTLFKIVTSFSERIAVLKPDSYFALDLPPGVHRFSWTAAPAKGETLSVSVAAGRQVFVKMRFRGMDLGEEREATRRMQTMEPISSPLAFDIRVSRRAFVPEPAVEAKTDAVTPEMPVPAEIVAATGSADVFSAERSESETVADKPPADRSPMPAQTSSGTADKPLTNDDVLMLVNAGFPRELIAAKIRSSKTSFDTSAAELVVLKKAGVHDSIILLMIAGAPPVLSPPSVPATAADMSTPETTAAVPETSVPISAPEELVAVTRPPANKPAAEPHLTAALDGRPLRRLPEPPKIVWQPQVSYPEEARRSGVQGLVEVDVMMRPDGSVLGLKLVSSPHSLLSETALHSVSKWQFELPPADDSNSDIVFRVVVKFAIE